MAVVTDNTIYNGMRVVRGPGWTYSDQDGPSSRIVNPGTVIKESVPSERGFSAWYLVHWDNGSKTCNYCPSKGHLSTYDQYSISGASKSDDDDDDCDDDDDDITASSILTKSESKKSSLLTSNTQNGITTSSCSSSTRNGSIVQVCRPSITVQRSERICGSELRGRSKRVTITSRRISYQEVSI